MSYKYSFENLETWQLSRKLTVEVYTLTQAFPRSENFRLINQIRRASVSISSNIAEGSSRLTKKEKTLFLTIAYGSALELLCQIILAKDIGYIPKSEAQRFRVQINKLTNKILALSKSFH